MQTPDNVVNENEPLYTELHVPLVEHGFVEREKN